MPQQLQHTPPNVRPPWVVEIFSRIDMIDSKLNKLDQTEPTLNYVKTKVTAVEHETQTLSTRLTEVEKSTRQLNHTHDDHSIRMDNMKAELACIHDQMKRQTENFNKKIGEQKRQIDKTANCVQEERQQFSEEGN